MYDSDGQGGRQPSGDSNLNGTRLSLSSHNTANPLTKPDQSDREWNNVESRDSADTRATNPSVPKFPLLDRDQNIPNASPNPLDPRPAARLRYMRAAPTGASRGSNPAIEGSKNVHRLSSVATGSVDQTASVLVRCLDNEQKFRRTADLREQSERLFERRKKDIALLHNNGADLEKALSENVDTRSSRRKVKEYTQLLEELTAERKVTVASFTRSILETTSADISRTKEVLESQNAQSNAQIQEVLRRVEQLEAKCSTIEDEKEGFKTQAQDLTLQVQGLHKQLEDLQAHRIDNETRMSRYDKGISELVPLKAGLGKLAHEIPTVKTAVGSLVTRLEVLQTEAKGYKESSAVETSRNISIAIETAHTRIESEIEAAARKSKEDMEAEMSRIVTTACQNQTLKIVEDEKESLRRYGVKAETALQTIREVVSDFQKSPHLSRDKDLEHKLQELHKQTHSNSQDIKTLRNATQAPQTHDHDIKSLEEQIISMRKFTDETRILLGPVASLVQQKLGPLPFQMRVRVVSPASMSPDLSRDRGVTDSDPNPDPRLLLPSNMQRPAAGSPSLQHHNVAPNQQLADGQVPLQSPPVHMNSSGNYYVPPYSPAVFQQSPEHTTSPLMAQVAPEAVGLTFQDLAMMVTKHETILSTLSSENILQLIQKSKQADMHLDDKVGVQQNAMASLTSAVKEISKVTATPGSIHNEKAPSCSSAEPSIGIALVDNILKLQIMQANQLVDGLPNTMEKDYIKGAKEQVQRLERRSRAIGTPTQAQTEYGTRLAEKTMLLTEHESVIRQLAREQIKHLSELLQTQVSDTRHIHDDLETAKKQIAILRQQDYLLLYNNHFSLEGRFTKLEDALKDGNSKRDDKLKAHGSTQSQNEIRAFVKAELQSFHEALVENKRSIEARLSSTEKILQEHDLPQINAELAKTGIVAEWARQTIHELSRDSQQETVPKRGKRTATDKAENSARKKARKALQRDGHGHL